MKIVNSSLYGKYGDYPAPFEKVRQLSNWLGEDVSKWPANKVHAVYAKERRKRASLFSRELYK